MRNVKQLGAVVWVVVLAACPVAGGGSKDAGQPVGEVWKPGVVMATAREPNARGLLDRRGLIHAHSVYSHDACDNAPVDDAGVRDQVCFEDFRRGLCQAKHDFVFLTDHPGAFTTIGYPEALLHRPDHGDSLVQRDGDPVASWAACPDGSKALIMAGTEGTTMPVGLPRHLGATPEERGANYTSTDPAVITALKASGAVALVAHTEDWTVGDLINLPLDGFEMFNLHANLYLSAGTALELLLRLSDRPESVPHPDLALLPLVTEDPIYISRWGSVLAAGARRVTTMGTDCHRNTFKQLMQDGERVDSYRRMMAGFSNHLLVRPNAQGTFDDLDLKDALRNARLFGVFEYLGFPVGFSFTAQAGGVTHEMGEAVPLAQAPVLRVDMPSLQSLDPKAEPPVLTARILKAKDGGWDEVAKGSGSLTFTPVVPGAYRAEIRMLPRHLRAYAGWDADTLVERDLPWIYGNAIHIQ